MEKFSFEEIQRRKKVWIALSQLWIDTDHDENSLESIACILRESNYTIEELEGIHRYEVTPIVWMNLLGIGEWIRFDPEWLENRISENLQKKRCFRSLRHVKYKLVSRIVNRDWDQIVANLRAGRGSGSGHAM